MRIRRRTAYPSPPAKTSPAAAAAAAMEEETAPPGFEASSVGVLRSPKEDNIQSQIDVSAEQNDMQQPFLSAEEDEEKKVLHIMCKKEDGKGWQCKREARPGHALCEYHIEKLKSYGKVSRKRKPKADPEEKKSPSRLPDRRQRVPRRLSDSFYYYSGFGPLWSKRRSSRAGDKEEDKEDAEEDREEEKSDGEEEGKPVKSKTEKQGYAPLL